MSLSKPAMRMDSLRGRFLEVRAADDARNKLIEDLLQQVDNMQKTMDRKAFTLVLIDGDGMNFLDELVKGGIIGGSEASSRLRTKVFDELRYDQDFRHDEKIVIKVYANLRGLSKLYTQHGLISHADEFAEFVLGFNKAHPLCDFIDAGNHKESADKKLQETLDLHVYNVHCKHIIFGGSTDNTYASFLASYHDIDTSRIRLLEGPPFAYEFQNILPKYKQIKFRDVFRSEKISASNIRLHSTPRAHPRLHSEDERRPRVSATEDLIPPAARPPSVIGTVPQRALESLLYDEAGFIKDVGSPKKNPLGSDIFISRPPPPPATALKSGGVSLSGSKNPRPSDYDVEEALIKATLEQLEDTPRACDFGQIKRRAEEKLGVDTDFWGSSEFDYWFNRSKKIIKWAVEEWMERTNSPPPGNATWLLRHFPPGKSPAAVLRSPSAAEWRTPANSTWLLHFGPA